MTEPTYGTSGGVEITDALVDQLAAEAEAGYEPAQLRRRGRPTMGDAAAVGMHVRLDPDLIEDLERHVARSRVSKSETVRRALRAYLRQAS